MRIKDHGDWVSYEPSEKLFPNITTHNILYCQRVSDKRDWYDFQRNELRDIGTIKATLMQIDGEWTVQTTARDPSFLFPAGLKLIEIDDTDGAVEHESLRRMRVNLKTHALAPALPWPGQTVGSEHG